MECALGRGQSQRSSWRQAIPAQQVKMFKRRKSAASIKSTGNLKVQGKSASRSTSASKTSEATPKFTKNIALQTEQLRVSLSIQQDETKEMHKKMAEMNAKLDMEVLEREDAERDVEQIRKQVQLLESKVKSLEEQYADEQRKTAALLST